MVALLPESPWQALPLSRLRPPLDTNFSSPPPDIRMGSAATRDSLNWASAGKAQALPQINEMSVQGLGQPRSYQLLATMAAYSGEALGGSPKSG